MTDDPGPRVPKTILRHAASIYSSLAMLGGMQLDVFTPLKNGALTCAEIAVAIGVQSDKLRPLLYALVNADLLTIHDERFSNTRESAEFLVRGMPRYVGGMHGQYAQQWQQTLHTAESIRSGEPQAKLEFAGMPHDRLVTLFRGLHPGSVMAGRHLAQLVDMVGFSHLADIGGGSGGLAIGICQVCPNLRATVVDLPNIAPLANGFIAEASLADRINTLDADVIAAPPPGHFDVAVLMRLIQVLSAAEARAVLRNVGDAVRPGGRIFIVGRMLDDTRLSPADSVGQNLLFLNIYEHGQAYTEREHRGWLADAGFDDITVAFEVMPGGLSLVSARKQATT